MPRFGLIPCLKLKDEGKMEICFYMCLMYLHTHFLVLYWFHAFYQVGHSDDLHCTTALPSAICVWILHCLTFCLHHLCFRPTLWRKGSQPWVLSPCRKGVCRFNHSCHLLQNHGWAKFFFVKHNEQLTFISEFIIDNTFYSDFWPFYFHVILITVIQLSVP